MSKITKKDLNERLLMVETLLGLHRALPEQISNDQANNAIFRMQCALSSGKEIAGRNPTEVEQRIEALEEFATYADNMLTELNHALPDPEYDAKCEAQEVDIDASLDRHRERLGLNKPQLKQLDQSIFDGLDEKWRFAAVNAAGRLMYSKTRMVHDKKYWWASSKSSDLSSGTDGYDASNWQNSLIERDTAKEPLEVDLSSELTGSELCKAMLARGDKYVMCFVHEFGDDRAIEDKASVAINFFNEYGFQTDSNQYNNAVPINNMGEPLTAAEVGL